MTRARLALALCGAILVVYAWLAVQVYRARSSPESFRAWNGPSAWIVGPSAKDLLEAAEARVERAVTALNDTSHPPAERLAAHRAELLAAEDLLIRSLRAQPAQPGALARLAAVRWELEPPIEPEAVRRGLDLIELAAQSAPDAPRVRLQLGELLLLAGRVDEALVHLRRAVELDPGSTQRAVAALRASWIPAAAILESLPKDPQVLGALKGAFVDDGETAAFLSAAEALLVDAPRALLEVYGDVALASGEAARLAERMAALPPESDPVREAERRIQLGRGLLGSRRAPEALAQARAARAAAPGDPRVIERAGRIALEANDPAFALDAFQAALGLAARSSGAKARRAVLYREIGQAQDALGRPDRAYPAYLKALALEPAEGIAKRRVEQLEKAAGVR